MQVLSVRLTAAILHLAIHQPDQSHSCSGLPQFNLLIHLALSMEWKFLLLSQSAYGLFHDSVGNQRRISTEPLGLLHSEPSFILPLSESVMPCLTLVSVFMII